MITGQMKRLGKLASGSGLIFALLAVVLSLAACGSSSSGGGPTGPANRSPTADAGNDQSVVELTSVDLAGSGSDPDGDTLAYAWSQTGGSTVALNASNTPNASFIAPGVASGSQEILTFQLTATDPAGLSSSDSVSVTVREAGAVVTISGVMSYEFPRANNNCLGLNQTTPEVRPIRRATVQLLNAAGNSVLASAVLTDTGGYSFVVDSGTDYLLRVRAELKSASWDVDVRNNVDTSGSPPPLEQRPIYVLDFPFNSGVADNPNMNLTATTGWGVTGYTGTRAAAPFAILDTLYTAMQFVIAEDPTASFAPLDAFWSPDNKAASPTDIAAGDLPTSYYDSANRLFLLGQDGVDTDEFDDHVVVHEWGHYFEDNFSRSDSIGGRHGFGDLLDVRLAFGEGFASALAAMALDEPLYCDTSSALSGGGFNSESSTDGSTGWFNELTVVRLLYDLWDTDDDGADNSSIGFGPIYDVMSGPQAATPAFTSIFTFATYLKQQGTGQDAFIDALLAENGINATGIDIYASTETNDGQGTNPDVLPLYTPLVLGGPAVNICVNSAFDGARDGNKLAEHRYLTLNLPTAATVTFTATANPAPSQPTPGFDCAADVNDPENNMHSDPDFWIWRSGQFVANALSCDPNTENVTSFVSAGDIVIDFNDFRHADDESPSNYPEQVCFDISAN